MKIAYGIKYKNSLKKIKNKYSEKEMLEKILNHIKRCNDFCEFKKNPISLIYGFEALKYEFNGYYRCNLNKNGGTVRLIFTSNEDDLITLEFVSTDHYKDFKKVI